MVWAWIGGICLLGVAIAIVLRARRRGRRPGRTAPHSDPAQVWLTGHDAESPRRAGDHATDDPGSGGNADSGDGGGGDGGGD